MPERSLNALLPPRQVSPVGVWLGVYGDSWVGNAIESVERQSVSALQVVAVLNGPSRSAEEHLLAWQSDTRHDVTVVVNQRNLGPIGSWYATHDLLTSPWVAILHQDDIYLPDHIATLAAAADRVPADVLAIFSTMEGVTEDGHPASAPLMRNRNLDLAPSSVTLPEILRRHPFPTPASAIRNPGGYVDGLAWFDSGAPDSEWFARLACRGRFRILDNVTVRYRQPATSESSLTGWESRAWQWAQSLGRLIESDDLSGFLAAVPNDERATVARSVLNAIPSRYPKSPVFGFLQCAAAQRMAEIWDYVPGPATDLIRDFLAAGGESAATRNLESIVIGGGDFTPRFEEVAALLGSPPKTSPVDRWGRRVYRRHGHRLPRWAQQAAYNAYDHLRPRRGAQ